jgi:NAD+ synthase
MHSTLNDTLVLDPADAVQATSRSLRLQVTQVLRRCGMVVAMSGGIDSSVCAALAVEALGPRRVLGLALPERESNEDSLTLAREWAKTLGIDFVSEDITAALIASGCYAHRDAAIARVSPYGPGWQSKLVFDPGSDAGRLPVTYLAVRSPSGDVTRVRVPARELREIVAATNTKQRIRAMAAYTHADRLQYAVCGTPNRLEYQLGFFVKGGDGLADVKPIAHLFKSQVYQLAEFLGVPEEIRNRVPTTDTYTMPQTQEEFFFALPFAQLDLMLHARERGWTVERTADAVGLTLGRVHHAFQVIDRQRRASQYLRSEALIVESTSLTAAVAGD